MKVGYIFDEIYLKHDTGVSHPECKERLVSINTAINSLKDKLVIVESICACENIINLVHPYSHIEAIKEASLFQTALDVDTPTSQDSYKAALTAAGAAVVAIDKFKSGELDMAFAAVRPPGHHAETNKAMGFCLFNNIAIGARYAQNKGYDKVLIVDFDVHHGNGTQEIFYSDDTVFYFGSHQVFAYPGTGSESERGEGRGYGYTANHPVMPGSADEEIVEIYEEELPKIAKKFDPDIILVSAGYDLHQSDPLASLNVTTEGIAKIVKSILSLKKVPYLFMLEGGYELGALGENVKVTLEEMLVPHHT